MTNAKLYIDWVTSRDLAGKVPVPDAQGYFWRGSVACVLPYLRAYWKKTREGTDVDESLPAPWWPETWLPVGSGFVRFLRADQALACVEASLGPNPSSTALSFAIQRALRAWLLAGEDAVQDPLHTLDRRVETIRLIDRRGRLKWSRAVRLFPDDLRSSLPPGVDPVHTPESAHAGLTRYLCEGWSIDDDGALCASRDSVNWGPSTAHIPHRLHDAPRRLMLGASLQARAVPLVGSEAPIETGSSDRPIPPGRTLRATFAMYGGWTHEDAIVLSESAAHKLARRLVRSAHVLVPAVAAHIDHVDLASGSAVRYGQVLARAFIDAYALGLRRHDADALGAVDGWIEVALPGAVAPIDGSLINVERRSVASPLWREMITFSIERTAPVGIGDKLSTRHGIKGVVSQVLPDHEMPAVDGQPAEIVLSPLGIIRRGAMGQLREAGVRGSPGEPPKSGTIFVMRQRQDADLLERCRVRGPEQEGSHLPRGQRYGEMEFWALMAHGAPEVAAELLSVQRSTASWMRWEEKIAPGEHRELATRALNRYLAVAGARYARRRLTVATACPETHPIEIRSLASGADALDLLEDPQRFVQCGGLIVLPLGRTFKITFKIKFGKAAKAATLELDRVYLLPPWLRPTSPGQSHALTRAYRRLITALTFFRNDTAKLRRAVRACVSLALDETLGAGGFLRREVLGRRLTRSARAVIVPRPDLPIDQIAIPSRLADGLFTGLGERQRSLVLVNRNPTLHRRGLLALRPVVESSGRAPAVFGLPLGVLRALGADFDGDQATVVALETDAALTAAEKLLPGAAGLRSDPFRPGRPAFPLAGELAGAGQGDDEAAVAAEETCTQQEWCDRHHELLQARLAALGDGWEHPLVVNALADSRNAALWHGLNEDAWRARAAEEMEVIYRSVRRKGRFGGILRRELYRRTYQDDASWQAVHALQAITERATQAALSTKTGEGTKPFPPGRYFRKPDSLGAQEMLLQLDATLDAQSVATVLGPRQKPVGMLAWMEKPNISTLLELLRAELGDTTVHRNDPRVSWFLE